MFDIVSWYESQTGSASQGVAALTDLGAHTVSGDQVLVPSACRNVMFAFATETNASDVLANARLTSPSLRKRTANLNLPAFNDMNGTASTTYTQPESAPVSWFVNSPIALAPSEGLEMTVGSSGTTAACLQTGVAGLHDGNISNPYPGIPIETIRYTAALTQVAHAWTNSALTITNDTLQEGMYAVLGMKAYSATLQAATLSGLSNTSNRPGCIGVTQRGHKGDPLFRQGNVGVYGQFPHTNIPSVNFLANAADSAQVVYLDVVRIG